MQVASPDLVVQPRRRLYLPVGWPLYALFLGFPLWWGLGLGGLIWPILAIPMAAWLFRQQTVLAPRGFAIWIAFLAWMLGSATQLDGADRWIAFGYRASLYVAATVVLLYVFNVSREALPTRKVIVTLAVFWMFVVAGGFLGVILPHVEFRSPVEVLMPRRLLANRFVYELVHPAFAQIHTFLGYPQPRPKAPFVYTNDWGSAFALLVPFVVMGWTYARTKTWKVLTGATFLASMVPVVGSLNRGLWLSLGVGIVYAAIRLALAGKGKALRAVIILIPAIIGMIYLTPLKGLIEDRFANPHSNERRVDLYEEAIQGVLDSPLFGFGSPRPSTLATDAPAVGTQGQLWLVLFSHGIPGAALFLWWFAYVFWKMRRVATQVAFWCHVVVLIALVQLPFYGLLPTQLVVIMIGVGLASREFALGQGAGSAENSFADSNRRPTALGARGWPEIER